MSSTRVDYVPAVCTHRPSLLLIGQPGEFNGFQTANDFLGEVIQASLSRGKRSRNKVSVGEPAEGLY